MWEGPEQHYLVTASAHASVIAQGHLEHRSGLVWAHHLTLLWHPGEPGVLTGVTLTWARNGRPQTQVTRTHSERRPGQTISILDSADPPAQHAESSQRKAAPETFWTSAPDRDLRLDFHTPDGPGTLRFTYRDLRGERKILVRPFQHLSPLDRPRWTVCPPRSDWAT